MASACVAGASDSAGVSDQSDRVVSSTRSKHGLNSNRKRHNTSLPKKFDLGGVVQKEAMHICEKTLLWGNVQNPRVVHDSEQGERRASEESVRVDVQEAVEGMCAGKLKDM